MTILLVSNHHETVIVDVEKRRSVRAATLRRDRTVSTSLKVDSSQALDLCAVLEVGKEEARQIVYKSPDLARLVQKGVLKIVDTDLEIEKDTVAAEKAAQEMKIRRDEALAELTRLGEEMGGYSNLSVKNPLVKEQPVAQDASEDEEARRRLEQVFGSPETEPAKTDEAIKDSATTITQLDPSVREMLSDAIPSTKWAKERLLEHARNKGLDVSDDMSKNALLRKLRNV